PQTVALHRARWALPRIRSIRAFAERVAVFPQVSGGGLRAAVLEDHLEQPAGVENVLVGQRSRAFDAADSDRVTDRPVLPDVLAVEVVDLRTARAPAAEER